MKNNKDVEFVAKTAATIIKISIIVALIYGAMIVAGGFYLIFFGLRG